MKKIIKFLVMNIWFLRRIYFYLRFVYKNKYIPNFRKPKTFNEKINFRKKNAKNNLFVTCADKIKCKEYVSDKVNESILIPNLYVGSSLSPEQLSSINEANNGCVVKANHNSGPVYVLTGNESLDRLEYICNDIERQLRIDFGKIQKEPWYSHIEPKVLIEERLITEDSRDLEDYKFHVFTDKDGTQKVVLHVDFDRNANHNRSFFSESLEWLPFSVRYPVIKTSIDKPKNYEKMLEVVKQLADPFSYVRVDLYNIGGKIYFGELTFAHGSGSEEFSTYAHDLWMGKLWTGSPSY